MKICRCGMVVPHAVPRCDECQGRHDRDQQARYDMYDRARINTNERKMYSTGAWKVIRKVIKARDHGLCKVCQNKGTVSYTQLIHHITPVEESFRLRLEPSNLISLCESCHKVVHNGYDKDKVTKKRIQERLRELVVNGSNSPL